MTISMPLSFCKHPEHMEMGGQLCRWPDGDITWTLIDLVPGVTEKGLHDAVAWGLEKWAAVCGVRPRYVGSAAEARILVGSRNIDGPGSILAECELPCGNVQQVRLWFDMGDNWTTDFNATDRRIIIEDVAWHELGHALGLGHAPQGSACIMAPVYNPAVKVPGGWDLEQSVSRYGQPLPELPFPPTPVPVPTPIPVPSPIPGGSMDLATLIALLGKLAQSPWFIAFLTNLFKRQSILADGTPTTITIEQAVQALAETQRG